MNRKDAETKGRHIKEANKERKMQEEIYAYDIMAQKKIEDISSGNITSFTQLLMSASTSSESHQESSPASVALASHLKSTLSVIGSNDNIDSAGGFLTQESVTSGWNEMVHKVKPFFYFRIMFYNL